ncbi:hypothetical protein B0H13DRAFT_1874193 [Mycena leptocephala]|nr:hypothetical protein B0H13DRAFT_1874193 [Mycena leptocephala]
MKYYDVPECKVIFDHLGRGWVDGFWGCPRVAALHILVIVAGAKAKAARERVIACISDACSADAAVNPRSITVQTEVVLAYARLRTRQGLDFVGGNVVVRNGTTRGKGFQK